MVQETHSHCQIVYWPLSWSVAPASSGGGGHPEPSGTVSGRQKDLFSPPFSEAGSEDSAGGDMDCQSPLADLCSPPGRRGEERVMLQQNMVEVSNAFIVQNKFCLLFPKVS